MFLKVISSTNFEEQKVFCMGNLLENFDLFTYILINRTSFNMIRLDRNDKI